MDRTLYVACFRHEDLKEMLDSNKDGLKLEAMKRIIGVTMHFPLIVVKLSNNLRLPSDGS